MANRTGSGPIFTALETQTPMGKAYVLVTLAFQSAKGLPAHPKLEGVQRASLR
jgi:hypothetical protein